MDIHRLTKKGFTKNVAGAIALSAVVIILASLLGRGLLKLEGSVTLPEPTELTVARLLEEYDLFPSEVYALPKRDDGEWRYSIRMRDGQVYFVRISPDGPPWKLMTKPEPLRSGGSGSF